MPNCQTLLNSYQTLLTAKHLFDASLSSAKIKTSNPDVKSGSRLERRDKQSVDQASQAFQALEVALNHLKETPLETTILTAYTTKENKEITFNISELLKEYTDFYQKYQIDWITPLPDKITLTINQITQMKELMKQGYNRILVIPENLVGETQAICDENNTPIKTINDNYEKLHQRTAVGYVDKNGNSTQTWTSDQYQKEGNFQGSKDKSTKFRLLLVKDVQYIKDDEQYKQTIGLEDLENNSEFKQLLNLTESAYLVWQRKYFDETGKHLDDDLRCWTRLSGSERPLSGRVPYVGWSPGGELLRFLSVPRGYRSPDLGCRLAGSFEVKV